MSLKRIFWALFSERMHDLFTVGDFEILSEDHFSKVKIVMGNVYSVNRHTSPYLSSRIECTLNTTSTTGVCYTQPVTSGNSGSSPSKIQQESPPRKKREWRFFAEMTGRILDLTNTIISLGRNIVTLVTTQIRDPLGQGAAAGRPLPDSPTLNITSKMASGGVIAGPVIDGFLFVFNYLNYKIFKKERRPLISKTISVEATKVNKCFYKDRKNVFWKRLGLNGFNVLRQIPGFIRSSLQLAGMNATTLGLTILSYVGSSGLILGGLLSLIKNSYVLVKTKGYLRKIKNIKVKPRVFLEKFQALQERLLKDKIKSRKIRIFVAAFMVFLGVAAILVPLFAASFGGAAGIIALTVFLVSISYTIKKGISNHRAKKKLAQEQLEADQTIKNLTERRQNLEKKIALLQVRLKKCQKIEEKTRIIKWVRLLSLENANLAQQIIYINEEIRNKTWKILPLRAVKEFAQKIAKNQALPNEIEYLKQCFELKNEQNKQKWRIFRKKREEITFEQFWRTLLSLGNSPVEKADEQGAQTLYDVLCR